MAERADFLCLAAPKGKVAKNAHRPQRAPGSDHAHTHTRARTLHALLHTHGETSGEHTPQTAHLLTVLTRVSIGRCGRSVTRLSRQHVHVHVRHRLARLLAVLHPEL